MKPIIFLFTWVLFVILPRPINAVESDTSTTTGFTSVARCIQDNELEKSVVTLGSHLARPELFKAEGLLRNYARRSPECRTQVIRALMKTMDQRSSGPSVDSKRYSLWRNGANLLADLHATEALDLLVANLNITDGLSISLSHYPAVDAVTRIGRPAIPKLQLLLNENTNPYTRKLAVYCIASIGGEKARGVLTKAVASEKDQCVNRFIRISLTMFNNKTRLNHIPYDEDGTWISAFYCVADNGGKP